MEMTCSVCGAPLMEGSEPHCSKCHATMTCNAESCTCSCGNMVAASAVKCDACLEM